MGKLGRELRMGIHNRFDIEVVDVETGEVKQKAQAFNVVCNKYYTQIWESLNSGVRTEYVVVGDGSGTPSASDTALFSFVGAASNTNGYDTIDFSRESDGIWFRQIKKTIPNTLYVGKTITEVGFSSSNTNGGLVTHAMLQDMNGNPISITHTATDVINIYCTIYLHYAGQDDRIHLYVTGLIDNTWTSANSLSNVFAGIGNFLLTAANWTGRTVVGKDTMASTSNSVSGSFTRDSSTNAITYKSQQIPVATGNINGIASISIYSNRNDSRIEVCRIEGGTGTFDPAHITSETVGIGDGTTTKFKTKFDKPYNAAIKINGAAISGGVSINKLPASAISSANTAWSSNGSFARAVKKDKLTLGESYRSSNSVNLSIGQSWVTEILIPEIGIHHIYAQNGVIEGSNDGITWVSVATAQSNAQMNQAGAHYRYYRRIDGDYNTPYYFNDYDGYNIIFDNPPAQGDVITIDYTTDYIPKDSDHVLDVELTFTFGEWTGE